MLHFEKDYETQYEELDATFRVWSEDGLVGHANYVEVSDRTFKVFTSGDRTRAFAAFVVAFSYPEIKHHGATSELTYTG